MAEGDRRYEPAGEVSQSPATFGDNSPQTVIYNTSIPVTRTLKAKCVITLDHYFTGRTAELQQLRHALQSGGTAGVTQAIAGLGGIGKSSLARAYANAYQTDYDAIFFLNASDVTSLNSSYRAIDRQFDPPMPAEAPDAAVRETVHSFLQSHDRYLLLVDNADFGPNYTAEDLQQYLPKNVRGHLLLTTRTSPALYKLRVGKTQIITLHDMEPDDAARLLWEQVEGEGTPIPSEQKETLLAIAKALYYFPLALEQAAGYIRQREVTFKDYLSDQKYGILALLEEQANVGDLTPNEQYRRAVSTTWMQNVEALQENGKEASVFLLTLSAFLAPEAIPLKEIVNAAALTYEGFAADAFGDREPEQRRAGDYASLLKPLLDYSLVTKDAERDAFDIHRLLQEVIRHGMPEEEQAEITAGMVTLLNQAFPSVDFTNWSTCERLLPHALAILEHTRQHSHRSDGGALLLNQTAYYLDDRGRYTEALPLFAEALSIRREVLPSKHPNIMIGAGNLAGLYKSQGQYTEALPLYVEALTISREVLPPKHPDIATSLNDLASLYESQGQYAAALPLYVEALAIRREVLPPKHPSVAISLNNLAELYKLQGQYAEALPLYVESVAIMRVSLGEAHPDTHTVAENTMNFIVQMAAHEKGLTMQEVEAMSEAEQQNLFTEPLVSFRSSVNAVMARLQ